MTDCEPEDPERARTLVSHTLCQYVASLDKDKVPPAMSLIIPTLLARTTAEGDEAFQETSARLLELAAVDPEVFRAVVNGMSSGQRVFLEEIIRSGQQTTGGSGKDASDAGSGQPTIALKMDFGG